MDKDLVNGIAFEIEEKKRVGTMRVDWNGSNGRICNQWNPTKLLLELKTASKIDLGKLKKELNFIEFDLLSSFQRVEKYCSGTGYDKEQLFSISSDSYNYGIKLIPVKDAYSYICIPKIISLSHNIDYNLFIISNSLFSFQIIKQFSLIFYVPIFKIF